MAIVKQNLNEADEAFVPSVEDAQSDPEPASPSLDEPDPGVFHREPGNKTTA